MVLLIESFFNTSLGWYVHLGSPLHRGEPICIFTRAYFKNKSKYPFLYLFYTTLFPYPLRLSKLLQSYFLNVISHLVFLLYQWIFILLCEKQPIVLKKAHWFKTQNNTIDASRGLEAYVCRSRIWFFTGARDIPDKEKCLVVRHGFWKNKYSTHIFPWF